MTADPRYGGSAAAEDGSPAGHRAWASLAVAEDHDGWVASGQMFQTQIAASSVMVRSVS